MESEYFIFVNVKGNLVYKTKGTLKQEKEQHKVFSFEVNKIKNSKLSNLKNRWEKFKFSLMFGERKDHNMKSNSCKMKMNSGTKTFVLGRAPFIRNIFQQSTSVNSIINKC
jgi:hypothetical protein